MADETFDITVEGAAAFGAELTQAFNPRRAQPGAQAAPEPDDTWELEGGTAWVWRVPGSEGLTNPVIIADGFSGGASKLEEWAGLWAQSDIEDVYPWGTKLHEKERDVIVLGYDSRCAPIRDNAEVAIECIQRATAKRTGTKPLVVGGLSMGGLVTRYALAKLEKEDPEHEVGTYFSYDSPHQGAWIPISLQVFAHFLAGLADLLNVPPAENEEKKKQLKALSDLINSTAARELLWKHTATHQNLDAQFDPDPARGEFLSALAALESTPSTLKKLGVANGRGDGEPLLGVTPGAPNLVWPRKLIPDTLIYGPGATLYAQKDGNDQLVAKLQKAALAGEITVKTTGIPALDGAPGGMLDSFGLAGQALKDAGYQATVAFPDVCFVPVASAVDLAEPSDPFKPIDEIVGESFLHEYKVASQNERHTLLTQELCDWLTEQF
jgi:hypothetical protein